MNVREMNEDDYRAYKTLFKEAYDEYLESLRSSNYQQYLKEKQEKREVTRSRFDFYLNTRSSFVAEERGKVIGYVASQTVSYMHGADKLLWIEYIVVKPEHRREGIGTTLLQKLTDYAKRNNINRIYTTISPDNKASIRLHQKNGFNVKNWKVASIKVSG